jgi:predicted alpha/beta superfamily hydrolase
MRNPILLFLSFIILTGMTSTRADTLNSTERTHTHVIDSSVLGEKRHIIVRTPPGYDPNAEYPVVYVTDGEWSFELVASYLDYMADNDVYPDLIVTAVTNVNRNRDYVPRADAQFEDTGKADRFLGFVKDEWRLFMASRYPVSGKRILIGHSFGGVFTMHTFFRESELFEAYIALGTSAWIANQVLFEEADAWFDKPANADAFVYMAVGEGDGGPTVPSGQNLAERFKQRAPGTLEWQFEITPRTDHFKNMASGMHDAFMALFPAWGFAEQLTKLGALDGAEGIDRWFSEKEASLGYRFVPAWFDLGVAALGLQKDGHSQAALATTRNLRRHHPENAYVASFSASVFEMSGQPKAAATEYQRAINIAQRDGLHPNAIHLGRLQRGLERVQ